MWMTLKLAWRNLLRNKRRTFITGSAVGVGLAGMIFVDALIIGMRENVIRTATASFIGEAQIHAAGYRQAREVEQVIGALDDVVESLDSDRRVARFTLRTMSLGMISSPANLSSVGVIGVQPETERHVSQVDDVLQQGAFFEGASAQDLVIGERLADLLELGLGDRVVLTVAQAHTGDLAQELLRVSGIYRFNSREMDSGMAFIRIDTARRMLGLGNAAHEIALTFTDPGLAQAGDAPFWAEYSTDGNDALGWPLIAPQLEAAFQFTDISLAILGLLLFTIVALGIVNTLFMSIYERMFEFGVLRALGTRPLNLWRLIVCEAGALAVMSSAFGMALGFAVTYALSRIGIDYRGIEMAGMTVRDLMYPVMTLRQFWFYPFWVLLFTLLVGTYPAFHAACIQPAEALRKSL